MNVNQLGEAYLAYVDRYDSQPDCSDNKANADWECCDVHRSLLAESNSLEATAKLMGVDSSGNVLSKVWWADVGRPDIYQIKMDRLD